MSLTMFRVFIGLYGIFVQIMLVCGMMCGIL